MDKVIVIGCRVPGLAIVRALANKNIHIIAMTYSKYDIAHLSRYVSEVVPIPLPEENEEQFIELLVENSHRWEGALFLETAYNIAVILSKNKEKLSRYYKIVSPDWDVLRIFVEKEKTYALAEECGVPHPGSYSLASLADLKDVADIPYPCILKPVRSFEFVTKFLVKNFKVNNETELREKYQLCLDAGFHMILQEIIPGPDENLYRLDGYINTQGKTVGKHFYRKLRQNPSQFGVMRIGISTERNKEVEEFTERLLGRVNYRGYFSIEYKKDSRDGQLKLIENNCRLVRCGLLATACGVNLPWIIYLDLVKNQQVDVTDYKKATYWIGLYADISNSIYRRNEENIRLRDYIKLYLAKDKVFAELDFHDLKPFMRLTSEKFRHLWNRVV